MAVDAGSVERRITDLAFPLSFITALGQEQDVLDNGRNRNGTAHLKNARHVFAASPPGDRRTPS